MADATEDVVLNFGEEDEVDRRKNVKHPIAVSFHLLFRVSALVTYLLYGWFSDGFITGFVIILLLLSMDFWTVKNITGRLLVGLRWWNHVDEDGNSQWIFESRKGAAKSMLTTTESRIFWLSIVVCEVLWVVLFFGALFTFKFKWIMVVCVALILNGANMYGYIRCKIGNRKKLSSVASSFMGQQMFRSMFSSAASTAASVATSTLTTPTTPAT